MSVVEKSVEKCRISVARGCFIKYYLWRKIEVDTLYFSAKKEVDTLYFSAKKEVDTLYFSANSRLTTPRMIACKIKTSSTNPSPLSLIFAFCCKIRLYHWVYNLIHPQLLSMAKWEPKIKVVCTK